MSREDQRDQNEARKHDEKFSFLTADGEMGKLIREKDWSQTPLGPMEEWPANLLSLVNMLLDHPFPSILLWGPELIQIYNDSYRIIAADKHPEALGQPNREFRREAWHINPPIYEKVMDRGESIILEDQLFPILRHGYREEAHFTLSYSPVRDDDGRVAGIFLTAFEATERFEIEEALREREARQKFLVELNDELRPLSDPAAVQSKAAKLLGEHLKTNRALYVEITTDGEYGIIKRDFTSGVPSFIGKHRLEDFGPAIVKALRENHTLIITDARNDNRLTKEERELYEASFSNSAVAVPLVKEGQLVAMFGVHQSDTRLWSSDEVALIEEVAERTWAAIERARAEKALRESEERYQTLFESIDEGFCIIEVLFDDNGKAYDYRFIEVNPAFEEQTGLADATGKTMRELAPNHEEHWFERYGEVAMTGEPARFEDRAEELGCVYDVYAFRVGVPKERRVAILFNDITERKDTEEELQKSRERLQLALEAGEIGTWEWNMTDDTIHWSKELESFNEMEPGTFEGTFQSYMQRVHPDDREKVRDAINLTVENGEPLHMEHRFVKENGDILWTLGKGQVVRDESGEAKRMAGVSMNITKRKETEKSKLRLAAIVESSDDAIISKDLNGIIKTWNRGAEELFGYTEEEALGQKITMIFPADLIDEEEEILAKIEAGKRIDHYETVRQHKNGNLLDVSLTISPLKNAKGKVIGASKIARDIAGLKKRRERDEFMLTLQNTLRPLTDSRKIMNTVAEMLGEKLEMAATGYIEMKPGEEFVMVGGEFNDGRIQEVKGKRFITQKGEIYEKLYEGEDIFIDDITGDERATKENLKNADELNITSAAFIPLIKNGELRAVVYAVSPKPHYWRGVEKEILRNTADFTGEAADRARAEEVLSKNEKRLEMAVDTAKLGNWELDLTDATLTCSEICKANFGISPDDELSYPRLRAMIHPEDYELWKNRVVQAIKNNSVFRVEFRIQRPDNKIHWIFAKGHIASAGTGGTPDKMIGVTQNITYRKRREMMEYEQSRLLEYIANAVPLNKCLSALCEAIPKLSPGIRTSISIADEKRESFQAPVAPDMLPSWREELDGAPINELIIGPGAETVYTGKPVSCANVKENSRWSNEWREMCIKNGVLAAYSNPIKTGDGETRGSFMLCFNEPREPDDWERQLIQFGTHIASIALERHRSKQALQEYNERLEERVHERTLRLKNNQQKLRALITRLNQAEEEERKHIAGELHDNLGQLLAVAKMKLDFMETAGNGKEVAEASDMINDAITYTRELMSSLQPPESLGDEDLKTAVKWVADKMKKYDLRVEIEDDGQQKLLDEEIHSTLLRAIRELLFNVVKHAHANKATVKLSRTNGAVKIAVEDEGDGFEADKQKSKASLEEGFGLYNVYERMERFNGSLNVTSKPGDGTKAVLTVPLKAEQPEELSAIGEGKQLVSALRESDGSGIITVMLVDDHDITREGLHKIITDAKGFKLAGEAKNGLEAVEKARELMPQAIIMDVNMPELNGIEATKRIKAEWPDIEIIGLSFRNDDDVAEQMRNAGASAFVTKSNATEEICAAILEKVNR